MKTSELTGAALDWAVAKCDGFNPRIIDGGLEEDCPDYSTNWAQGGPIIEREKISVLHTTMRQSHEWEASSTPDEDISVCEFGPTPLIAALRCYVASKLGDNVELPNDLLGVKQ